MRTTFQTRRNAFTFVELMVIMGLGILVSGIAYMVLNTGLLLFAKNTSMNVAHQQARMAMLQMQRQMYQAVSPLQLTNDNGDPVTGVGPSAGISFHVFAAGPFPVTAAAAAKQNLVSMNIGSYQATTRNRLVITTHDFESDLTQAATGSGNQTLTLKDKLTYAISIQDVDEHGKTVDKPVYGFLTERVVYRVKNGELLYQGRNGETTVLAREITSDTPFSQSNDISKTTDGRFMAAVNLSTGKKPDPRNRYRSTSIILNAEVPARAVICLKP